jgi:putative membrane protein
MRKAGWFKRAVLTGVVLSAVPAHAAPASQAQHSGSDEVFLKRALSINEEEVQLGHLAAERASSPEVKAMGQTMVQNHTRLGRQLGGLATQAGTSPSAELTAAQRDTLARLRSQPGSEFDAAFKRTVDEGHVKELAMYRDWLGRTQNPQIRTLAEGRVESLQKSLGMATPAR